MRHKKNAAFGGVRWEELEQIPEPAIYEDGDSLDGQNGKPCHPVEIGHLFLPGLSGNASHGNHPEASGRRHAEEVPLSA